MDLCNVFGRVYKADGSPAKNQKIKAVKVVLAGTLISTTPVYAITDSNGDFSLDLPQGATAWLYAEVDGVNANGRLGVPLAIPAASSAELTTLVPETNVPGTVPVAVPGAPIAINIGDGIANSYTITHGLETEDLFVSIRETSGTKKLANVTWESDVTDPLNKIVVTAAAPVGVNALRVLIKK